MCPRERYDVSAYGLKPVQAGVLQPRKDLTSKRPISKAVESHAVLTLSENPGKTWKHFMLAMKSCVASIELPSNRNLLGNAAGILTMVTFAAWTKSETPSNYHKSMAELIFDELMEATWWLLCGFVATAGLGSGVQTGALFLFPHITRMALEWDSTGTSLFWACFWPGFWDGTGSAIGELVPFVLARAIKRAGGDPFALLESDNESSGDPSDKTTQTSSWTPKVLLANTRKAMEKQLAHGGFWKIAVLGAIPNAFFDLCGLVCGSLDLMSLSTFFLALWVGKALIRTPGQTCALGMAVFVATSETQRSESKVVQALQSWGRDVIESMSDESESPDEWSTVSFLKLACSIVALGMIGTVAISTIEQIAQHHSTTHRRTKAN